MNRNVLQGEVLPFNRTTDRNRRVVIIDPICHSNNAISDKMELLAYRGSILIFSTLLLYLLFQLDSNYRETVNHSLKLLRGVPAEQVVFLPSVNHSKRESSGDQVTNRNELIVNRSISDSKPRAEKTALLQKKSDQNQILIIRRTSDSVRLESNPNTDGNAQSTEEINSKTGEAGNALLDRANHLAQAGQWRKALILYTKACPARPNDARCQLNLAVCLDRLGEIESALHAYLVALQSRTPALPEAARAQVLERLQELQPVSELS